MKRGTVVLIFCSISTLHFAACFNVEREETEPGEKHSISKRQTKLTKTCNSELYEGVLAATCKLPSTLKDLLPEAKKCFSTVKAKDLKSSEAVCLWDCAYQAKKWVDSKGVLNSKTITADINKGLDKAWTTIVADALKKCLPDSTKIATAKLASGYSTKCNRAAYFFNTCFRVKLYEGCPKASQGGSFSTAKAALAACDYAAITKTTSQLAAQGLSAVKNMKPEDIAKGLAAAKSDPSMVKNMLGGQSPADLLKAASGSGVNLGDLAKKIPAGFDINSLGK